MSQFVLYETFKCITKDLGCGNKIFQGKSQHSPYFSKGKRSCWFQEVNSKLGLKNNRKQLQARILTNSKYFIKNNSSDNSICWKGNVIDCKKSNVTLTEYNYNSQQRLTTRQTRTVFHLWSHFILLLLVTLSFFFVHNKLKCWFLVRGENRRTRGKTSRNIVENQQTQFTYDSGIGNRTRNTLVEGECSHHHANPAPWMVGRKIHLS